VPTKKPVRSKKEAKYLALPSLVFDAGDEVPSKRRSTEVTRRDITEDSTLHTHRCDNFTSNIFIEIQFLSIYV
jgi:hypothetical protein